MLLYQILVYIIHGKIQNVHIITVNLQCEFQRGMKNLNYLTDHILNQIFKVISSISLKNMKQ